MAVVTSQHQQRVALFIAQVGRHAEREQAGQRGGVAAAREVEHFLQVLLQFGVAVWAGGLIWHGGILMQS